MENLKELTTEELVSIDGGGFFFELGAGAKRLYNNIVDGLEYLNEAGQGNRMHSAG